MGKKMEWRYTQIEGIESRAGSDKRYVDERMGLTRDGELHSQSGSWLRARSTIATFKPFDPNTFICLLPSSLLHLLFIPHLLFSSALVTLLGTSFLTLAYTHFPSKDISTACQVISSWLFKLLAINKFFLILVHPSFSHILKLPVPILKLHLSVTL